MHYFTIFFKSNNNVFFKYSLFVLCMALSAVSTAYAQQPFITTWKTDNPGTSSSNSITIPTQGGGYNYQVDWNNDGIFDQSGITGEVTHTFGVAGTRTIRIRGLFPRIFFNNTGDKRKLLNISQWGDIGWTSMESAFSGCENLNITATDLPNLSQVTSMAKMFNNCVALNDPANIGKWNTGNVSDMHGMFTNAGLFNQPIGNWNTDKVTNLSGMFTNAYSFEQPIGNWNTANVINMTEMFWGAGNFNQPIGNWNTAKVTNMSKMFKGAGLFNQPIGNWDVANVTDMLAMFSSAGSFNQPIDKWNTANVTDMEQMFSQSVFNQPIGDWNTAKVTNMRTMFSYAQAFNKPIGNWNTSNVTTMDYMFNHGVFNQPIGNWNTANVTSMQSMFDFTSAFNQAIGNWNTSQVTNMRNMFSSAKAFNQAIGNWNTTNVTAMQFMFAYAEVFNQPIGNWNITKVSDMRGMFLEAPAFNQPIGNWNTSSATTLANMFNGATTFNQPIGNWNTAKVKDMGEMFKDAKIFNKYIGNWNTASVTNMFGMFVGATAFNQSLGGWSLNPSVKLHDMLNGSGLDCPHYSATLIGWGTNPATPNGLKLGAIGLKFGTNASAARIKLDVVKNWTISGDLASGVNCIILPTILSFTGGRQENDNRLSWEVTSDATNLIFDIERSADTKTFEKVGFVDLSGDAKSLSTHRFLDASPLSTSYYRLKIVEANGDFTYSDVISVRKPAEKIVIYPNPTSSNFYLQGVDKDQKLVIKNSEGKEVHTQLWSPGMAVKVDHLPDGPYYISVDGQKMRVVVKKENR